MTAVENSFLPSSPLAPNNRKHCNICKKCVYLHQPVLLCDNCTNVFHGKCLGLNNYDIFNIQQTNWFCDICSPNNNLKCHACSLQIFLKNDKLEICKNCFLPVHKNCSFYKTCVNCTPEFNPTESFLINKKYLPIHNYSPLDDDYYNDLPIFNPFDDTSDKFYEGLTEGGEVYEKFSQNERILNFCKYYSLQQFVATVNSYNKFNNFLLIGLNIDGFKTNFDKFNVLNTELIKAGLKVSCFCFLETNITLADSGPYYINGYNKFISDRIINQNTEKYKKKGSGIAIYVDKKYTMIEKVPSFCTCTTDIEILTVTFTTELNFRYYLVGVYRPPHGNFTNAIDTLDLFIGGLNNNHNIKIHIVGDFNIDLYHPERIHTKNYLECLFSNGFHPTISRATHFQGINPTCIDHILTNSVEDIKQTGVIPYNITHHMLTFSIFEIQELTDNKNTYVKPTLCINSHTISNFVNDFNNRIADNDIIVQYSAKDSFHEFLTIFKELYDKWFLHERVSKCKHVHVKSDWITPGLAKSSETKNILYTEWRKAKTASNWNKYLNYKRKYDIVRNKLKFEYYNKKFNDCKSDTKKVWGLINNVLGRKKRNSVLTFTSKDASHNFNKYFTSVASKLISENYANGTNTNHTFHKYLNNLYVFNEFSDSDFDILDLNHFITELNINKSTYYSPKVLKSAMSNLSPTLIKLFNKCLSEGYFPDELKTAKVLPIFKNKGDINDITNYRPISLLSVFSKLFEKLIHKKLYAYFDDNNIINENQFGFRPLYSTSHALINATENLYKSLDNNLHSLGIFIDFSKAFDTVDHAILCSKLEHYGIHGKMLKLITNYLSGRDQYVSYGNKLSSKLEINHGVPQGSVLGPLLFIIFINDIVNSTKLAKFVLYADDSNLFISHFDRDTVYKMANIVLSEVFVYCSANKIVISYDKCCFIEFKPPLDKPHQMLAFPNHEIVICEDKCKFLGIYINSNLDWSDQIVYARKLISQSIGALYSIKSHVPQKILRTVYFALVQPYFIYAMPVWASNHSSKDFDMLFKLQKKAIRIITNHTTKIEGKFQHTKPLFKKAHILTVHNLFYYFTACEAKKILCSKKPAAVYKLFDPSTRSARLLMPKFQKDQNKSKSFVYNSCKILNFLLLKNINYSTSSLETFKINTKRFLIASQNVSLKNDPNWLPNNFSIFSDIKMC